MIIEDDMLSASMALTAAAAPLQLPRVLLSCDDMVDDADEELAALLKGEADDDFGDEFMCSGRADPIALQFMSSAHELVLMHARAPEDAIHVHARRF
jgi:hypothetical protein